MKCLLVLPNWESHNMELEYKEVFFDDLDDIAEYITTLFNESLSYDVVKEIYTETCSHCHLLPSDK
jgi:hypothetical protein